VVVNGCSHSDGWELTISFGLEQTHTFNEKVVVLCLGPSAGLRQVAVVCKAVLVVGGSVGVEQEGVL
jgi:hypothetical protein